MSRPSARVRARNPRKKTEQRKARSLDPLAREAIDCLASIVARCGYSPDEVWRRVKWKCDRIPKSVTAQGNGTSRTADAAAHILTLWFNERGYAFPNGEPRPLPERGPAPSIEALVQRVGANLTHDVAMKYLLDTRSLRKVESRYVPRTELVSHRGNPDSQRAHHMRTLADFLRTLEHNTQPRRSAPSWFQFAADNHEFPVSERHAFHAYMMKSGSAFLKDKDSVMYRLAQRRRPGGRTVPMTVCVYLSEGPGESKPDNVGRGNRTTGAPRPLAGKPKEPGRGSRDANRPKRVV